MSYRAREKLAPYGRDEGGLLANNTMATFRRNATNALAVSVTIPTLVISSHAMRENSTKYVKIKLITAHAGAK